jgi:hypothetical protein
MARTIKIDNAILKKRRYQKPKKKTREIVCRILIVCEGEKTEPNYFRAFDKIRRGSIVYEIETGGGGINTIDVVDEAIRLRGNALIPYDRVWAVFDRDSFPPVNFNNAIKKAEANGINCAWSNEAFEIWYLLHFHNRITAMSREEYRKAISDAVNDSPKNKSKKKDYVYAKNDPNNHRTINQYGCQDDAIRWAQGLHEKCMGERYHKHNPCTLVYKLVLQLMGVDKELNDEVSAKIEE